MEKNVKKEKGFFITIAFIIKYKFGTIKSLQLKICVEKISFNKIVP